MLKPGIYRAEQDENWLDRYMVRIKVKETEKSYIFQLVDFQSRYSAVHIERFFQRSNRVVIRKDRGGHAIRAWSAEDFTFYPFQAGIPYYFKREQEGTA